MAKPLVPLTDPLEIRDATVRDYVRNAVRMGYRPDVEAISRLAVADLILVDNAKREAKRAAPAANTNKAKRKREDVLAKAQQETGVTIRAGGAKRTSASILNVPAHMANARWTYACARIMRILQGTTKKGSLEDAVKDAQIPALAREYADLYINYFLLRNRIDKNNPFLGLNDRDASRKFMRLVENICDRSTGVLGGWFVK